VDCTSLEIAIEGERKQRMGLHMNVRVPEDVREEAIECKRGDACLDTGHCTCEDRCKVRHAGDRNVLFLDVGQRLSACPYLMYCGIDPICTCPVNYYLYTHQSAN